MTTHREELERTLATAPFAEVYGFVLVSIEDDSCTLRIPFRPVLERPGGIIAGHVCMAAADVRMWLAEHAWKAIYLYGRSGYIEVEAFNAEPYAHHWFEKQLV